MMDTNTISDEDTKTPELLYFYRGKYDGLAPQEKQYSPSPKGEETIVFT